MLQKQRKCHLAYITSNFFFQKFWVNLLFILCLCSISFADAPVCSTNTLVVIGASLEEAVPIPCRVNSDPPEIEFEWTFSSSGEHFEVPSAHYATIQETTTTTGDIHRTIVESNDTHFETYGMLPTQKKKRNK